MTDSVMTPDPTDPDSLPDLDGWELQHLLRAETAARAAGRREALAEMAAWHKERVGTLMGSFDAARRSGNADSALSHLTLADVHDLSARHAKALAAAADDPAGPLPLRVRYRSVGRHVSLRVFVGPEHGGALSLTGVVRAEELAALRAGWPGACFIEETDRGTG